jgi:hypothetical protein
MIDSRTIVNTKITDNYILDIFNEPHKEQLCSEYYLKNIAPVILSAHFGQSDGVFLTEAIGVFMSDGSYDTPEIKTTGCDINVTKEQCRACSENATFEWIVIKNNKQKISWHLCTICHKLTFAIAEIYNHLWCVSTTKSGFSVMDDITDKIKEPAHAKAHLISLIKALETLINKNQ